LLNQLPTLKTGVAAAVLGAGTSETRPLRQLARFEIDCRGLMCLLNVKGDVDASNGPALEAAITAASRTHRGVVVVSFAGCRFADSSCVRVLIRQFKVLGARLAIVAPPASRLRRLLDVTSLTNTLPVYTGLRHAQLAIASIPPGSLGGLTTWNSSDKARARLEALTFMLRASPRFSKAGAGTFSLLRQSSGALGEPAPNGRPHPGEPETPQT
jgi:anti-anti-sigma factor